MTPSSMRIAFYFMLALASVAVLMAAANPYRLRKFLDNIVDRLLPEKVRQELLDLSDAWAGQSRMTQSQINLLSLAGLIGGGAVGVFVNSLLHSPAIATICGAFTGFLFAYYPRDKFQEGVPKSLMEALEREAPLLAGFMYRARGVSGLSVQQSFLYFMDMYGDTETASLVRAAPESVSMTKALLSLEFPSAVVPNWLEVISTLDGIQDLGKPDVVLKNLRDRIQDREEQYLRGIAKRKAFKAPVVTVLLLLLPLMGLLLVPIGVEAMRAVGGL